MKNLKIAKGFVGHEFWPGVAFVDVEGRPSAEKFPRDETEQQMENVIQSWNEIVILRASPTVPFKFGYTQGNAFHYLKEIIEVDSEGRFGVRIGDGKVRFFVLPTTLDQDMKLEIVEITKETDPKYPELPLY
jgi:hypothetical protein